MDRVPFAGVRTLGARRSPIPHELLLPAGSDLASAEVYRSMRRVFDLLVGEAAEEAWVHTHELARERAGRAA
jgi:hypothetical protein